jgi:hypothetical protein
MAMDTSGLRAGQAARVDRHLRSRPVDGANTVRSPVRLSPLAGRMAEVPGDMSMVVPITTAPIDKAPRRVDCIHLPAVHEAGRELFAPLSDLEVGEARICIGRECGDGLDEFLRRVPAAREFLLSFGISRFSRHYRDSEQQLPDLLRTPRAGGDRLTVSHA